MRLLLIRHGQTTSNVGHYLDTAEPGASLTEFGWRQAHAIPAAVADEGIGHLVVSTLVRTQQTASPLAQALQLQPRVEPGVREISAGDLEMCNDQASIDRYVETVFGWGDDPDRRVPGGETGREVLDRFDTAVRRAAEEAEVSGRPVAIVSHGAVIRVWTGLRVAGVGMEFAATHWLPNTGLVAVEGHPDEGWSLVSWGEWALGGPELSDPAHTGPAGEPEAAAVAESAPGQDRQPSAGSPTPPIR